MVHANEVASQAEKDVAIRQASGFNHLFEAVLNKELSRTGRDIIQLDPGRVDRGLGDMHITIPVMLSVGWMGPEKSEPGWEDL